MKKIIFILFIINTTVFGQCVTPNPTQCNTVINGTLTFGPLCTASWGNIILPITAGGLNRTSLISSGQMLMSNGSAYIGVNPSSMFLMLIDTNTVVMTRHDADSAIAIMQTSIAGKISTEIDPIYKADSNLYLRKTGASSIYQTKLGYTPYNSTNPSGYISSFTELDPTVPSYSKTLTAFSVIKTSTDALYATIAQVNAKFTTPTGTTSQYVRGDGSLATLPSSGSGTVTSVGITSSDFSISGSPVTTSGSITANLNTTGITAGTYGRVTVDSKGRVTAGKRQETYSGTTVATLGTYTVTFGTAYSAAPNIQANIIGGTPNQFITMSVTTTGFVCTVYQRNTVNLLSTELLLGTTVLVSGATVDVLISEK